MDKNCSFLGYEKNFTTSSRVKNIVEEVEWVTTKKVYSNNHWLQSRNWSYSAPQSNDPKKVQKKPKSFSRQRNVQISYQISTK